MTQTTPGEFMAELLQNIANKTLPDPKEENAHSITVELTDSQFQAPITAWKIQCLLFFVPADC
jgi:hypothetical protein